MEISLFYNNVTVIDYAYVDKQVGLVGHSLIVNVRFLGQQNEEGILYDFSFAKKKVKEIIDRECDHRLVVPEGIITTKEGNVYLKCEIADGIIEYSCPDQAICEVKGDKVTLESLKDFLQEVVMKEMPDNILSVEFDLNEENNPENFNYLSYTHGLKGHHGNCQRLLHGHRSTFRIFHESERMRDWENEIFEKLFSQPIHFAYLDNVLNKDEILKMKDSKQLPEEVCIGYESPQGNYLVKLPGKIVYFLEDETTVENLTIHFAQKIKALLRPKGKITVQIFEGVGKGAIVSED